MKSITDPADPHFWEKFYLAENRPWENSGIPKMLNHFLTSMKPAGRVLLPGCGSAYEMKIFLDAGWDAWGIDFSETAVKRAKKILQKEKQRILFGDFFNYQFEHHFDLIYERSFLCALPPRLREAYARRIKELLVPEGRLVGFFLQGAVFDGPPFPMQDLEEAKKLFSDFQLMEDRIVEESSSFSGGKEYWRQWKIKTFS